MPELFGQRGRGRKGSYSPPLHTDLMSRLSSIPSLRGIRAISWLVACGQTVGLVSWVTLG